MPKAIGKYFFFLGLAFCFAVMLSCENDLERVKTISGDQVEDPVETSKGITVIYSDSAKVVAKLTSPLLKSYKGKYDLMPQGLKIVFYNDTLGIESSLTSKYGRRDLEKKQIELEDSVVVINANGEMVETERLVWLEEGDRVFSDRFVKITTKESIIMGNGLETNTKFSPYSITNPTGTLYLKNTADTMATDSLKTTENPGIQ